MSDATVYGYVYEIVNKVNGKVYIGQTTKSVARRWQKHRYDALNRKSGMAIHRAMKKHGLENFTIEVMCEASSKEELDRLEQTYISGFNTLSPHGYNLKSGGSACVYSEESKQKMSESQKVFWDNDDVRKAQSERAKKQFADPDKRAASSLARRGKPSKKKGNLCPGSFKPIIDSNGAVYPSVNEAAAALGYANASTISNIMAGRIKSGTGLTFTYYEVEDGL